MPSQHSLQRLGATLLALVCLAVSCATSDEMTDAEPTATTSTPQDTNGADDPPATTTAPESESPTTTTTTEPVERTASFRGVSEDTIDIGVAFWDTSIFGFGFFGDAPAVWTALTDAQNARGGVHGRMLAPTVAGFNPADNEGMLAVCIELTEDAEVFAILGGLRDDANYCVFEQHETILVGSQVFAAGEVLDRAKAPIAGIRAAENATEAALINELDRQGWFDGGVIGIHFESTEVQERAGDSVSETLSDIGVDVAIELVLDDLAVDDDTTEAQIDIMREQVRSAGITHMVMIGAAATGLIAYGEFDIQLAATESENFATAIQQGVDPLDLDGTVAVSHRVNLLDDPVDAKTQQCLDDVQAALPDARFEKPGPGVENTSENPNYWAYTVLACRDLDLFIQAATAAGVELTNDSFGAGLESLSQTSLPEIPFVSFGPGKYHGGDTLRLVEFDSDADEDGELVPLGDPVDLTP